MQVHRTASRVLLPIACLVAPGVAHAAESDPPKAAVEEASQAATSEGEGTVDGTAASEAEGTNAAKKTEVAVPVKKGDEAREPGFHLTSGLGYMGDGKTHNAYVLEILALKRFGRFAVGANGQLGAFWTFSAAAGPSVGMFARTPRWLDLWVVSTVGVRSYEGVGTTGLFRSKGEAPGAGGTLGFGSVRGIVALAARNSKGRGFTAGVHALFDMDFVPQEKTITYVESTCSWLELYTCHESGETKTVKRTVGAPKVGAILALGATF